MVNNVSFNVDVNESISAAIILWRSESCEGDKVVAENDEGGYVGILKYSNSSSNSWAVIGTNPIADKGRT